MRAGVLVPERGQPAGDHEVVGVDAVHSVRERVDERSVDVRGQQATRGTDGLRERRVVLRGEVTEIVRLVPDLPVADSRKALEGAAVAPCGGTCEEAQLGRAWPPGPREALARFHGPVRSPLDAQDRLQPLRLRVPDLGVPYGPVVCRIGRIRRVEVRRPRCGSDAPPNRVEPDCCGARRADIRKNGGHEVWGVEWTGIDDGRPKGSGRPGGCRQEQCGRDGGDRRCDQKPAGRRGQRPSSSRMDASSGERGFNSTARSSFI
jgi:hypothetical protein